LYVDTQLCAVDEKLSRSLLEMAADPAGMLVSKSRNQEMMLLAIS